jgi:neutral ceramidase
MGYAKLGQKGTGIHLRQYSRAFIIDDGKQRLAFVSVDCAMIGNGLRKEVSEVIKRENSKCMQSFCCETAREEIVWGTLV